MPFLSPSTDPYSLGRIGHYEVLQILGKGGFGIVLRAFDEVLQRVVALKVLAPALAATSRARKRFLREARSSAKVRHENVVQVHAVEEQPLPYLVMEFIPGETLQQRLDRTGPLDVPQIVRIGRQIAEGLAAAHATGLIHRDIKPDNILLEEGPPERVKITDFGMARAADDASLSQNGVLAGTPMYMAPEQAEGETLTPLKGMKLKYLHVGSTLVHDLSPLVGMPLEDLGFSFTKVTDIAPLQGMKLTSVGFEATDVADLTPLKGMALRHLAIGRKVTDLSPLTGMPLEVLTCHEARVSDLSPLKGMPLKLLVCSGSVSDLSPLRGMPLSHLGLARTKVYDLTPLRGMRLIDLGIPYTNVSDLSPLVGMPLQKLQCQGSKVTDLSPVKDLPLTWLSCDFRPERDAKILRAIPTLKTINGKPAVEFWRSVGNK